MNTKKCSAQTHVLRRVLLEVYKIFMLLYGIDLTQKKPKTQTLGSPYKSTSMRFALAKMSRIVSVMPFVFFVINRTYKVYKTVPSHASCIDIITGLHHLLSMTILFVAGLSIFRCQDTILQLLPPLDNPKINFSSHLRIFSFMIFLNSPYFIIDCKYLIDDLRDRASVLIIMGSVSAIYIWNIELAAITIYVQASAHICEKLQAIDAVVKYENNQKAAHYILSAKAKVRRDIATLNDRFGMFIFLLYLKIFTLVAFNVNKIVTLSRRRWFLLSFYVIGSTLQLIMTFTTCQMGSRLINLASRTHRRLYEKNIQVQTSMSSQLWIETKFSFFDLRDVLAYREEWDSLCVYDCFVNRKSTMFAYIGTLISLTAIILQFDYKILRILDRSRVLP